MIIRETTIRAKTRQQTTLTLAKSFAKTKGGVEEIIVPAHVVVL